MRRGREANRDENNPMAVRVNSLWITPALALGHYPAFNAQVSRRPDPAQERFHLRVELLGILQARQMARAGHGEQLRIG